jgi:hypothetical protein
MGHNGPILEFSMGHFGQGCTYGAWRIPFPITETGTLIVCKLLIGMA